MNKKKQIVKELETLYSDRFKDYKAFMDEEKYEEAQAAFNDCTNVLAKIAEVDAKRKLSPADIATLGITATGMTAGVVSDNYWRYKTFKFEETGTISSSGGKKMIGETFQKYKLPKKI